MEVNVIIVWFQVFERVEDLIRDFQKSGAFVSKGVILVFSDS